MPRPHATDLDERGLSPRDKIKGDVLTIVGFSGNKRRVSLKEYMAGEFESGHIRRSMGWILPSLDGHPPHEEIMRGLLNRQENLRVKLINRARHAEQQARNEEKRARKAQRREAAK